jgi:hypothetical protein
MNAIRSAALAIAFSAGVASVGALAFAPGAIADRLAGAVVDQAFGALDMIPTPTPELRAALRQAPRADRVVAKIDGAPRSVTFEVRTSEQTSTLVRVPATSMARL